MDMSNYVLSGRSEASEVVCCIFRSALTTCASSRAMGAFSTQFVPQRSAPRVSIAGAQLQAHGCKIN